MAVRIKTGKAAAVLSITPLIDVVFMLLVFFIVTSNLAEDEEKRSDQDDRKSHKEELKIPVELPDAPSAVPLTAQPKELNITIDKEGRFFIGNTELAKDEVLRALKQADADNPGTRVVNIRPDKDARVESLIFVIDKCNEAEIFDYNLLTQGG